jgi:UDP-2,3-diacylglucosamine pyrophosphatase LpxH
MKKASLTAKGIERALDRLAAEAPVVPLSRGRRWVILSDLHMGNGGPKDNFRPNAELCARVLADHYLGQGFGLILNGDIEELQRFSLKKIRTRWRSVFDLFRRFQDGPGLIKLVGNHDLELVSRKPRANDIPVGEAVKLEWNGGHLLVFHGHQARLFNAPLTTLSHWVVRLLIKPLGIGNGSVAGHSRKKFRIEKRAYRFASRRGLAAVLGHTHRPLFESMSKLDALRFKIEQTCRRLAQAPTAEKSGWERKVRAGIVEMQGLLARHDKYDQTGSLYQGVRPMPCLFNSGCATGKSGLTAIEIAGGRISLVHWFDGRREGKYLEGKGYLPEALGDTGYYRLVLKEEALDYVFTLIRLQTPRLEGQRETAACGARSGSPELAVLPAGTR